MSDTEIVTRRSRADRERDVPDDEPKTVVEQPDEQISPEDALANVTAQLKQEQSKTADARRALREQEQIARRAQAEAHQAVTRQVDDRTSAIDAVMKSAQAEVLAAQAAYRAAREAGDIEAEMAAQDTWTTAKGKVMQASAELERIKATPKPQPQQQQPGQQFSAETQRWMDDHPEYASNRRYRAVANEAHNEAVRAGHRADTPGYFDYINDALTEEFGENHGRGEQQVQRPQNRREAPVRERDGDGIPPSRSRSSDTHGWKTAPTDLGSIQYRVNGDGSKRIRVENDAAMENFREGAKTSFARAYERDPNEALKMFLEEMIAEHEEGGGTLKVGDGRLYR